jgi:hypothetical protein
MIFISDDRPLSDVNNAAVRAEIGERLRSQRLVEMPSNLLLLMERLRRRSQAEKYLSPMKEFSNGSFSPDTIKIMATAMEGAISTLPHPVAAGWTQALAESILRSAKEGERDPAVLARLALLELTISPGA